MMACARSRLGLVGVRVTFCVRRRRRASAACVAHLAVLCVVRCVARGFCKLAENFFKKVLDRNRRSVNIVDAPFTGN